jgi:hypothetical protein
MRIGISQARLYTYVLYSVPGRRLHTEPQSTGEFASNFAPLAPSVRAILFLDTVLYKPAGGADIRRVILNTGQFSSPMSPAPHCRRR